MQEIADELVRNATRIGELLRTWDTDKNGLIDRYEFRNAVKYLGIFLPYETVDSLFDAWDADGSGSLDYRELMLKARRAAFDRGFVPKNAPVPRPLTDKLNAFYARKTRMAVDAHRREVEAIKEVRCLAASRRGCTRDSRGRPWPITARGPTHGSQAKATTAISRAPPTAALRNAACAHAPERTCLLGTIPAGGST